MNLASVCHLPDSDTLRLSLQESRRNLNDLLAIVQDWKRRMSAEKFLEAVTALQHGRPCPEGFSLAKSPQEQAFTTKKVMILDRNHPYLPSHARGAQADSGQVAESALPTASTPVPESPQAESAPPTAPTPPPESPQEQAFTTNQVMILTSNDWHPCLPSHTRGTQAAETAEETAAEPGVARRKRAAVHYPWPFVSPQLLNTKGEEIYFPVVDDKDRCWARRLEWAIDHHRDLDEAELNGLQAHFEKVLRRSRDHHQLYIKSLQEQLESAHKRLRELRRP
jgi:hypothetical protein